MLTDEVRHYIELCIAQGMTMPAISVALIGSGWSPIDAEAVLSEFRSSTGAPVQPLPPLSSPLHEITPAVAPTEIITTPNTEVINTPPLKKRNLFVGIIIIIGMLLSGGAVSGYVFFFTSPTPEAVLLEMMGALSGVHAYAFETKIGIGAKSTAINPTPGAGAGNSPGDGAVDMALTATGTVQIGKSAEETAVDISTIILGNVAYGPIAMKLDTALDLRRVNQDSYVRAQKYPDMLTMFTGVALTKWTDRWIKLERQSTGTSLSATATQPLLLDSVALRTQLQEAFTRNMPIVLASVSPGEATEIE